MTSLELFPLVAEGVTNAGVIGRFGETLAAVMHGNATLPVILPQDPGKQGTLTGTPANARRTGKPSPSNPPGAVVRRRTAR